MLLVVVFSCWLAYIGTNVSDFVAVSIIKVNIAIDSSALECTTLSTAAVAFASCS
jgi:hypothetical protein